MSSTRNSTSVTPTHTPRHTARQQRTRLVRLHSFTLHVNELQIIQFSLMETAVTRLVSRFVLLDAAQHDAVTVDVDATHADVRAQVIALVHGLARVQIPHLFVIQANTSVRTSIAGTPSVMARHFIARIRRPLMSFKETFKTKLYVNPERFELLARRACRSSRPYVILVERGYLVVAVLVERQTNHDLVVTRKLRPRRRQVVIVVRLQALDHVTVRHLPHRWQRPVESR